MSKATNKYSPEVRERAVRMVLDGLRDGFIIHDRNGKINCINRRAQSNLIPTPTSVAINLKDVTEERETQARLRLLDAAVSQLTDMVVITVAETADLPGPRVVFVNQAFETVTGYSPDGIMAETSRILPGPGTKRERLDEILEAIETRQPRRTEITNYQSSPRTSTATISQEFPHAVRATRTLSSP